MSPSTERKPYLSFISFSTHEYSSIIQLHSNLNCRPRHQGKPKIRYIQTMYSSIEKTLPVITDNSVNGSSSRKKKLAPDQNSRNRHVFVDQQAAQRLFLQDLKVFGCSCNSNCNIKKSKSRLELKLQLIELWCATLLNNKKVVHSRF